MKKRIIIPLTITLLLVSGFLFISSSQEETQPDRRIIDMHLHAIPVEHFPHRWDEWAGFGDRIMYGSDHMLWPQSFAKSIGSIESAEFLSEEQKDAIFYSNATRFLGLKD